MRLYYGEHSLRKFCSLFHLSKTKKSHPLNTNGVSADRTSGIAFLRISFPIDDARSRCFEIPIWNIKNSRARRRIGEENKSILRLGRKSPQRSLSKQKDD
jgi:hypothetical protein